MSKELINKILEDIGLESISGYESEEDHNDDLYSSKARPAEK